MIFHCLERNIYTHKTLVKKLIILQISAGGGKTTTTTRTHSDGTRIRTETFSYSGNAFNQITY